MTKLIQSPKSILNEKRKDSNLDESFVYIDIAKTTEENIEKIINKDLSNNIKNITKIKIILELLKKLENFKEFIMLYNIEQDLIIEMLSVGTLKAYKKNSNVYKKNNYPEYYFLVLCGSVAFQNMTQELLPGNFFGEKFLIINKKYRTTCYSNNDNTILLLISKDYFLLNLKNKISKGNDKIKAMILRSFKIFRMVEIKELEKYFQKMIKLFPIFGETIISNKEIANAIYLIYEGSCVLNNERHGDLIILERGDIFGDECLTNFDDEGKITKKRYIYNIINKSQNTIIFKFLIKDLSKYIINGMKTHLSSYFLKREEIIKKNMGNKKEIENNFKKQYDLFKRPINTKEIIYKYCFNNNILTTDKIRKSFYNVLSELRLNRKNENLKKKIMPNKSKLITKKPLQIKQIFQNIKKNAANMEQNNLNNIKSNLSTNNEIRKILCFSEDKKSNKNNIISPKTNSNFNHSSKMLTISDNNNNNSNFYLTSINLNNKTNGVFKEKFIYSQIRPFSNMERTITESSNMKNKIIRKIANSGFSSNRCSTTCKSMSMSVRKQIETYGCTVFDTMSYFNNGNYSKMIKRNYSTQNKNKNKIINNKKNFFYQTHKYNIPLYVLLDAKEKRKFPDIINFS